MSSAGSSDTAAGTVYTIPTTDSVIYVPDKSYPNTYRHIKHLEDGGQASCALYRRDRDRKVLVCKKMRVRGLREGLPLEVNILNDVLPKSTRFPLLYQAPIFGPYTYIFLEYCDAGDLDRLMAKYEDKGLNIPESFIWHVFIGLAEALALIHHNFGDRAVMSEDWQPVIHRDIKPANIFLKWSSQSYPDIKLGDWGLAAVTSDFDFIDEPIGTYQWQGPELPAHSVKGDVWSLGAVIHACCLGYGPAGPEPETCDSNIIDQWRFGPKRPSDIDDQYSAGLQYWLLMTLKRDPAKRISSLELMRDMVPQGMAYRAEFFTPLRSDCLPKVVV